MERNQLLVAGAVAVATVAVLYTIHAYSSSDSNSNESGKKGKKGKTIVVPARDAYDGPSSITIPSGASTLPRDVLIDKIKGLIYGQAIGDAIGLATEFMNKQECIAHYGKYKHISYKDIYQDFHRSRWIPGDWTDDTDQMILIMEALLATGGKPVDASDYAKRLKAWVKGGFPELGDVAGLGLGGTVGSVVSQPTFETNPHACSIKVWENQLKQGAANGAVMRTSILGVPNFHDLGSVVNSTQNICKVTHADPRCVASCVFVTSAIALMLQGAAVDNELLEKAYFMGNLEMSEDKYKQEYFDYTHADKLSKLNLDLEPGIGYTFKCLGSGVFCLRYGTDFKESINELVMQGGDSDTNAAVAGALLGCKLGYAKLPQDWLSGLHEKEWLDEKVIRFLQLLGLN